LLDHGDLVRGIGVRPYTVCGVEDFQFSAAAEAVCVIELIEHHRLAELSIVERIGRALVVHVEPGREAG